MRRSVFPAAPFGSPVDHFACPAALVIQAVDSLPNPRVVLSHTQLALEQTQFGAQLGKLQLDVREPPVQIPVPPNAAPAQMSVGLEEVM